MARPRAGKPFDAATKYLLEVDPASWLALIGLGSTAPARLVDADLATVTTEADKVVLVDGPAPWLAHFELQASRDLALPLRLLRYNILLDARHGSPVHSAAILLRPRADGPELTGLLGRRPPVGGCSVTFSYQVIRVWELPAESLLAGGPGTLPLVPLAGVETADLPDALRRVGERIAAEARPDLAADLWAATGLLAGLVHPKDHARSLVRRISAMFLGIKGIEESWFYQDIFAEGESKGRAEGRAEGISSGRADEARSLLARLGTLRFGEPTPEGRAAIDAIADVDRLESLLERLLTASSWDDLLAKPPEG